MPSPLMRGKELGMVPGGLVFFMSQDVGVVSNMLVNAEVGKLLRLSAIQFPA